MLSSAPGLDCKGQWGPSSAHEGLLIEADVSRHSPALDSRGVRARVRAWRRWLDWEVQMERPHVRANVSVWNLGPLGYAASKEQLREALNCNRAVVMVQEVYCPLGAQRRVKRELNDLHPDYHCILEVGREALTDDAWDVATNKGVSPWCSRKHFAVASFFHTSVFKTVQRLEWDTEGKTRRLRHMTRGRVLWVDHRLHLLRILHGKVDGSLVVLVDKLGLGTRSKQLLRHTAHSVQARVQQGRCPRHPPRPAPPRPASGRRAAPPPPRAGLSSLQSPPARRTRDRGVANGEDST